MEISTHGYVYLITASVADIVRSAAGNDIIDTWLWLPNEAICWEQNKERKSGKKVKQKSKKNLKRYVCFVILEIL